MAVSKLTIIGGDFPHWGAIEAAIRAPTLMFNGLRKIVRNVTWSPGKIPAVDLERLGYKNPAVKLKALNRMYFNHDEVERVRTMLKRREDQAFTAASLSMRAGAKRAESMGWCIESIAFSVSKGVTRATVMYRSTELIKKFGADLAFIPLVYEALEVEPVETTFFFSNAFLSGLFYVMLFEYVDPIRFLDYLRKQDGEFFWVSTNFLKRLVVSPNEKFPFSPEQLAHEFAWSRPEAKKKLATIRQYLDEHHS
jgi:hypothetical protein